MTKKHKKHIPDEIAHLQLKLYLINRLELFSEVTSLRPLLAIIINIIHIKYSSKNLKKLCTKSNREIKCIHIQSMR